MTDRPILFSGPMVRAILEGRKTQTRRLTNWERAVEERALTVMAERFAAGEANARCPYGVPGDRLWVRETWMTDYESDRLLKKPQFVRYRATDDRASTDGMGWRPSIFMPRWACRLVLEVTAVRVERLQEIGETDAKAEGVEFQDDAKEIGRGWYSHDRSCLFDTAAIAYRDLWDSLNAKRAPWASNPWVWVIEFRRAP